MNITQDVVTDLLPSYTSGEASADTRALVDEFLKLNPQFAAIVQAARGGVREPLLAGRHAIAPDLEREAVSRTRAVIRRQRRILAFASLFTMLPLSFTFGADGIHFLLRQEPRVAAFLAPAATLWFVYARLQRRLRSAGL